MQLLSVSDSRGFNVRQIMQFLWAPFLENKDIPFPDMAKMLVVKSLISRKIGLKSNLE